MATGTAIRTELINWGFVNLLGTTTATASASDHLVDTARLASEKLTENEFEGCFVRVNTGTGVLGDRVRVDYLDIINGRLYVSPSFSTSPPSGSTYEIWQSGVDPDDVDRARDKALTKKCSTWYYHPISAVPNSAYIEALASANWEALGATTVAKQSLSFPYELFRDSILCTNAALDGGVESANIYVQPGQSWYLYVPVSVRSGTGEVIVRDNTNNAEISLNGTATETLRGWSGIEVTFTIPSGCQDITVRLTGQEATAIVEWGPVYMHRDGQRRVPIPARITTTGYAGPVFAILDPPVSGKSVYWGEELYQEVNVAGRQQVGDAVVLQFARGLTSNPYAFAERLFYDALSTDYQTAAQRAVGDAASTTCPLEYVVPAMVRLLAEDYIHKQPERLDYWTKVRADALQLLAPAERTFGPIPMPVQERGKIITVPYLRV